MYEAIVVALVVFLTVGGHELIGFSMLYRPIVVGPLIGLFLGDIKTGLLIGASLETIFMGVVNIGGASSAEPGLATALSTAFAIRMGGGVDVALPLALPLGIIGLQIKNLTFIAIVGPFAAKFDKLAAEGKEKAITSLHFGLWVLQWGIYSLIPFFAMLLGADAVESAIGLIPNTILDGLNVAGGLLPAVGMAMLLKLLWDNKIAIFFLFGFLLVAYLELPLIAVSAFAVVAATLIALRDYQIKNIEKKTRVDSGKSEVIYDSEEEEFLS